jgi:hypothetical protein
MTGLSRPRLKPPLPLPAPFLDRGDPQVLLSSRFTDCTSAAAPRMRTNSSQVGIRQLERRCWPSSSPRRIRSEDGAIGRHLTCLAPLVPWAPTGHAHAHPCFQSRCKAHIRLVYAYQHVFFLPSCCTVSLMPSSRLSVHLHSQLLVNLQRPLGSLECS